MFNTHLDHVSEEARINGIQVVLDKIAEFGGLPAFLMGDLNAYPDEETITFTKANFDDAHLIAKEKDEGQTFHKWGTKTDGNDKRIDYIMISKGAATVSEYRIVKNIHNGVWSSDHHSIYIKAKLN